jgi:phosphoglycerate dehydrogenase-like enzyme
MEVVAWSPNLTDERAAAAGVRRVDKKDLFAESDVVTLHMPLSSRSVGIVGASELALLRPSAYLINISRGALVDEPALIDALTRRSFAGYAADVFEVEPLPLAHPFRFLPNVLATPHNGYVVGETFEIMYRETVENIQAYLAGKPIRVVRRDAQKHGQSPPTHG